MLSFALSLLGIGKRVMGWLSAAIKWIFADIHRIVIALLLGFCVWLYVGKASEARRADKMTVAARKWETSYVLMVDANRIATEKAKANVKRVADEYERIGNEAEKDYADSLAANHSALERWKLQNRRSAASQDNSATGPEMPTNPMPETTEAVFSVRGEDLEIAADNYSQLVALITWAENIGEVETVPTPDD